MNVTKKLSKPLSKKYARAVVDKYAMWCLDTTPTEIAVAFRVEDEAPDRILGCTYLRSRSEDRRRADSFRGSERGPEDFRYSNC